MRLLTLAAILALTTSCVNFKGSFTADRKLKLKHTTVFGNVKNKSVPAGRYQAKVKFSSEDKIKLTLENGSDDIEIKMKLPSNRQFPTNSGRINLPANKTGQNYDIEGFIDTEYSSSGVTRTTESCSYTRYERRCTKVCDGGSRPNRPVCRTVCDRVPVSVYGRQDVEYRTDYTDRELELSVVLPNGGQVGRYFGTDRSSNKVYLYQGRCF
jgi:hypothetical protein